MKPETEDQRKHGAPPVPSSSSCPLNVYPTQTNGGVDPPGFRLQHCAAHVASESVTKGLLAAGKPGAEGETLEPLRSLSARGRMGHEGAGVGVAAGPALMMKWRPIAGGVDRKGAPPPDGLVVKWW